MSDFWHETEDYEVVTAILATPVRVGGYDYTTAYAIVNKTTGVEEFVHPCYPETLHTAEAMQHSITGKTWEWRRDGGTAPPGGGIEV